MKLRTIPALLAALLFCVASANATEHESDIIEVADWLDFEFVGDPQISPDGRQIVYTRRYVDAMNDNFKSSLWIMDADGRPRRSPQRHSFQRRGSSSAKSAASSSLSAPWTKNAASRSR